MSHVKVIRICAGADLLVTGLFALPFLATMMLTFLFWLNGVVSEPVEIPEISHLNMLFINLMGTLGVVWALARLMQPYAMLGWIDAWARLWVSAVLIYFLTKPGVPAIMSLFIATELLGAWAQFWVLREPEI